MIEVMKSTAVNNSNIVMAGFDSAVEPAFSVVEAANPWCTATDCARPRKAKGYCGRHYAQLRLYGHVLTATKFDGRGSILEGDIARIPVGVAAKDGFVTVDAADRWLDEYSWSDDGHGYAVANKPGGGMMSMHRLLMGFPNSLVDHRDGDTRNNRRSNLRMVDFAGNARNQKRRRDNRTGFKGVSFDVQTGRYRASIRFNRTTKNLGRYDTAIAASMAYDAAAVLAFGEFAKRNDPIERAS